MRARDLRALAAVTQPDGFGPIGGFPEFQARRELDEFAMCPDERHRRSARPAGFQVGAFDWRGVPDLFRNKTGSAGHRFDGAQQAQCLGRSPGRELIMAALAGKQRPDAAAAGAVEGTAVVVLAVAVVVIAMPAGAERRLG